MDRKRCTATTKSGNGCNILAQENSEFCVMHDPQRAEQLAAGRRKGGRSRGMQQQRALEEETDGDDWPLIHLGDIQTALAHVARSVLAGKMGAREAAAATAALKELRASIGGSLFRTAL